MNTQAGGFNVLLYHRAVKEATKNRPPRLGGFLLKKNVSHLYYTTSSLSMQRKTAPSVRRRFCVVIGNGGNRKMKHAIVRDKEGIYNYITFPIKCNALPHRQRQGI